jgi:hypothetical protein
MKRFLVLVRVIWIRLDSEICENIYLPAMPSSVGDVSCSRRSNCVRAEETSKHNIPLAISFSKSKWKIVILETPDISKKLQ